MKQNIEIEIPDGYEIENIEHAQVYAKHNPTQLVTVQLKKKQTKDFSFYVDEYLRSDCNTTNDMLCNWFEKDQLERIGNNLKQNKLDFVPWEVKTGLFKFVCKDKGYRWSSVIYNDKLTNELKEVFQVEYLKDISQ